MAYGAVGGPKRKVPGGMKPKRGGGKGKARVPKKSSPGGSGGGTMKRKVRSKKRGY